jgi:hypothetical protein
LDAGSVSRSGTVLWQRVLVEPILEVASNIVMIRYSESYVQEGDADDNDMEDSDSEQEHDNGEAAGEKDGSEPDSDDGDHIPSMEEALKVMQTKQAEPESPPQGPLHGLELSELPAEQLEVTINETDKLTHMGRVMSVVDGIIVVKVRSSLVTVRSDWFH